MRIIQRIARNLKTGMSRVGAAILAGIHEATFIDWMHQGETARDGLFFLFFQAVHRAEREAERAAVIQVRTTERSNAWFLARRFQKEWREVKIVEHTGKDGGAIEQRQEIVGEGGGVLRIEIVRETDWRGGTGEA